MLNVVQSTGRYYTIYIFMFLDHLYCLNKNLNLIFIKTSIHCTRYFEYSYVKVKSRTKQI